MQHISKLKNTLLGTFSTWTAELYPIFPRILDVEKRLKLFLKKSNRVPHNTIFPRNWEKSTEPQDFIYVPNLFLYRKGLFKYNILRKTTRPIFAFPLVSCLKYAVPVKLAGMPGWNSLFPRKANVCVCVVLLYYSRVCLKSRSLWDQ